MYIYNIMMATKTSARVIITRDFPSFNISLIINSFPMLNAITAKANSLITEKDLISYELINLINEGPRNNPNTK